MLDHLPMSMRANGSENDTGRYVTGGKVSGGRHGDRGCDHREAFLDLAKSCQGIGGAIHHADGCI